MAWPQVRVKGSTENSSAAPEPAPLALLVLGIARLALRKLKKTGCNSNNVSPALAGLVVCGDGATGSLWPDLGRSRQLQSDPAWSINWRRANRKGLQVVVSTVEYTKSKSWRSALCLVLRGDRL